MTVDLPENRQAWLKPREMALARWMESLVERRFPEDSRKQVVALCNAAMVLAAADENGLPIDVTSLQIADFGADLKYGAQKRGAKRAETAIACMAITMAKVKEAAGESL